MTSQARIDANRKNALLSTGAITAEGKERCRLNALKHGLRAEEVVLPTESQDAFNSFLAGWMDNWKPPTETRRFLVEHLAVSAWRLKRCVKNETQRLSARANEAAAEWDHAQVERVDGLVSAISDNPEAVIVELKKTRLGVDSLTQLWGGLLASLIETDGWCTDEHHDMLCSLAGIIPHEPNPTLRKFSNASEGLLARTMPIRVRSPVGRGGCSGPRDAQRPLPQGDRQPPVAPSRLARPEKVGGASGLRRDEGAGTPARGRAPAPLRSAVSNAKCSRRSTS